MKRFFASSLAAFAALAVTVAPLAAQTQTAQPAKPAAPAAKPSPAATPTPPPAQPDAPPPYEAQLLRLAELIGALTYLRDLCGDGDGAAFRAKFAALVDTEGTTDARKESLAGAFNRGFRDYELTYRACTPTAREIVARFLDEASRIAKDVANRYSG
ncbi:MAG: TIGR02301 family protein [Roseiarcus sp.]